ncbi:MAG: hypothetical protein WCJ80_04795 [Bacteroidota bacterium]
MKKNNIKNLESLNRYIADLENKELQLQNQLHHNWQYLKSDFGSILRTSILHKAKVEGRASFIYWLFKIPEFNNTIGKTAERLTVKLENLLVKWIDKIAE